MLITFINLKNYPSIEVVLLMKKLTKKVKKLDILDIKLMHAGTVFLTLFALLLIPQFMTWVHGQSKWLMLGIAVVLFARPCYKYWKK